MGRGGGRGGGQGGGQGRARSGWAGLAVGLVVAAGAPALAAGPADPDWPCVQRKVERLSLGAMWPHALPEAAAPLPAGLEEAAARLALRRVSEEEAQALLARVAAEHPALGVEGWGEVFRAAFERIDADRAEIVAGIVRYARNQARLAAEIEALRAEMAGLEAAEAPDHDRMDEVEAEIDWRVRIWSDRNRALSYVCESPVLLEQRAFAVARMILAEAS